MSTTVKQGYCKNSLVFFLVILLLVVHLLPLSILFIIRNDNDLYWMIATFTEQTFSSSSSSSYSSSSYISYPLSSSKSSLSSNSSLKAETEAIKAESLIRIQKGIDEIIENININRYRYKNRNINNNSISNSNYTININNINNNYNKMLYHPSLTKLSLYVVNNSWSPFTYGFDESLIEPSILDNINKYISKNQPPSLPNNRVCQHQGKVFGIGLMKSGTTSVVKALDLLGYRCRKTSCLHMGLWEYVQDASMVWKSINDIVMDIFQHPDLAARFYNISFNALAFGDSPWCFLFPIFDKWYPNSKFILTMRGSPQEIANSHINYLRKNKKFYAINGLNTAEFAMLVARRYELHYQYVVDYFQKQNRSQDLLIINFGDTNQAKKIQEEIEWLYNRSLAMNQSSEFNSQDLQQNLHPSEERTPINNNNNNNNNNIIINRNNTPKNLKWLSSHWQWKPLVDFLGCDLNRIEGKAFPHVNRSGANRKKPPRKPTNKIQAPRSIPIDMDLNWKRYFGIESLKWIAPYVFINHEDILRIRLMTTPQVAEQLYKHKNELDP